MNKYTQLLACLTIFFFPCTHAMEQNYVIQAQTYKDFICTTDAIKKRAFKAFMLTDEGREFCLTRPYGRLRFDCLPDDIVENHIKPYFIKPIVKRFKHRLLNYEYQQTHHGKSRVVETIAHTCETKKIFSYHDGTYTIIPDKECRYTSWDEVKPKYMLSASITTPEHKKYKGLVLLQTNNIEKPTRLLCLKEEYKVDRKKTFFLAKDNGRYNHFSFKKIVIRHCSLSSDQKWLALGTSQQSDNIAFMNGELLEFESHQFLKGPITLLEAAHSVPLWVAGSESGEVALVSPYGKLCYFDASSQARGAAFSPDDTRFFVYTYFMLSMVNLRDIGKHLIAKKTCKSNNISVISSIRKASFSPEGDVIAVACANGEIGFLDGCTINPLMHQNITWRCEGTAAIDDQAPLILWSKKNNLFFSLDPAKHTDDEIYTFIVRQSMGKFRFLTMHNFFPNNPRAMGLTEDERSVVFIHEDESASVLHLYTDHDSEDIDFIEKKADLFQLCKLWNICTTNKVEHHTVDVDDNAIPFITAMRACIADCKKGL